MKTKLKANELEQVNGGNIFKSVKDILKKFITDPFEPEKPITPEPVIARGKC
ncbi:MAG: hypothetical protein IKE31_06680 [Eubacterium sp.]|nr:hypothetical protein [Eubacterium sp.]